MTALWILAGVAVILSVIYQMRLFDCLVRWEYEHHRDQWERDGRPEGYFWRPKEAAFWSSDSAKKQLGFVWLFRTPDWIAERPDCRRWLNRLRTISFLATLAVLFVLARLVFRVLLP